MAKQISANQESYNVTFTVIAAAAWQARAVPQQSTYSTPKQTLHHCFELLIQSTTTAQQYDPMFKLPLTNNNNVFKLALQLQASIFYKCRYHEAGLTKPFMMDTKAQDANTFLILVLNSITMILSMEKQRKQPLECVTKEPQLVPTMQCHVGPYTLSNSYLDIKGSTLNGTILSENDAIQVISLIKLIKFIEKISIFITQNRYRSHRI